MKIFLIFISIAFLSAPTVKPASEFYRADHQYFRYTGRIDFSNLKAPRFWAAGVYVEARFKGTFCEIEVRDEMLWGSSHNYLEVSIDGLEPIRIKATARDNRIMVADNLNDGEHTIVIMKGTEALIGYLEFIGLHCQKLLPVEVNRLRKIEFIGDSITSGMGNFTRDIPCDSGFWYDQHSAWYSYASVTARNLNADHHLTSESGIGLIHSCCEKTILMPQVFDNVNISKDSLIWNFAKFQPDVVTICLGQNDGIQDSVRFCNTYSNFISSLRGYYPKAKLICLTSPMADEKLRAVLTRYLQGVVNHCRAGGEKNLGMYSFNRQYQNGCGRHPDKEDDKLIAAELTSWLRAEMSWQ
jgi:Carbohydrate esterase 2 N-terminal/GDSL-like Lipase/Acylhydrolase family